MLVIIPKVKIQNNRAYLHFPDPIEMAKEKHDEMTKYVPSKIWINPNLN